MIQVKLVEAVYEVLGHEAASDVVLLAAPLSPLWTPLGLLLGRAMAEEGAAIALVLTAPACFRF